MNAQKLLHPQINHLHDVLQQVNHEEYSQKSLGETHIMIIIIIIINIILTLSFLMIMKIIKNMYIYNSQLTNKDNKLKQK